MSVGCFIEKDHPPGFDAHQDGHMGLHMVFALAEGQLRAKVSFQSESGVSYKLQFVDNLYIARV